MQTAIQGSDHLSVDRREGSCTDDLESSRLQATTSSNASSSRSGKTKNIDPAQAEAWFMTALANPNSLQARETWNSYNALPLDRRKLLPLHVYSRLAKVQKTLQLKRRGSLWSRLSSIYEVWQERQAIPIAELSNTIQMLRYWFEQKEVIHSSRDFGQARRFCCHIAKLLNPYLDDDLVELEQLTDLINDYGTTSNLKEVVTILSKPLTTGRRGIETGALTTEGMRRLYTKVISRLAQRSELEQALVVTSDAWGSGILIDVQECGRNVLVALYALQTEDPDRLKKHVAILKEQSAYKDDHHPFRTWLAQIEAINEKMQLLRRNGEEPDIVGLLGSGGNEQTIALVSAKFRIRRLLSSPIRPLQNGPARHDPASVLKVLYDAIEAMKIYDQYLSHGFEADRELYRLAKMSKKRIETQSSFSSSLREAALMRLQEERDKQVRNFKKKWLPPRPITTHSQLREAKVQFPAPSSAIQADSTKHIAASSPQAAEATAADLQGATQNIYANAHVGQILHLAIELGDYDLARAVLPVAMEDSTFTWTRHDDERALAILKILLRDAGRPDITTSLRRNASQIASAFYVRWQEDLARDPKAYIEHRSGSPRHLRSPAFLLLRLLAHQQETESFEKAMQVLVQDPSIKLSAQHIRVFVAQIFKSSRCLSNIAFKLFVAKNLFSRASGYQDLKAAAESIASDPEYCRLPVQDQAFLHWCEHILHFTKQLGVTPRLSLLKDVLDMYEGHLDSEHDSLAAYIVSEMWKSGMKPAHGLQELLVRNRFRASSSALREFLKLLEEGSVTSAASRAEDTVKVLMASNLRTEALHVCELFVAASKESLTETSMEVKEAIEAMRHELQRATEAPARAPITVAAEEDLTSTVACAEMEINENRGSKSGAHVTPSVATETLPQRQGKD